MLTALLGAVWGESAPSSVSPHEAKPAIASASAGSLTLFAEEERECLDLLLDAQAAPTAEIWIPGTPASRRLPIATAGTVAPPTREVGAAQARAPPTV
jgi:hypothetical protein